MRCIVLSRCIRGPCRKRILGPQSCQSSGGRGQGGERTFPPEAEVDTELGGIKMLAAGYTSVPGRGGNRTEDVARARGFLLFYRRKERKVTGL